MRIAITGPTGTIGSDLVSVALSKGHEVIAIIRPSSSRKDNLLNLEKITVYECEISEYKSLFGKDRCDVFIHLAWMKTMGQSRDDTYSQLDNMRYSLDAVNLAYGWGAKAFLGAGSQAEYGMATEPLSETTPVNPTSGYGIAKYAAGRMCALRCSQLGIRFNWARILSVFGKNDSKQTLIRFLIDSFKNGIPPELTKCEQIWDYIYSKDAANAILAIAFKGKSGRTYAIGSGKPRFLKEYVLSVRDLIDPTIEPKFGAKDYYPHQAMVLCADITDLIKDTGYAPEYSFEEGIKEIIRNDPLF